MVSCVTDTLRLRRAALAAVRCPSGEPAMISGPAGAGGVRILMLVVLPDLRMALAAHLASQVECLAPSGWPQSVAAEMPLSARILAAQLCLVQQPGWQMCILAPGLIAGEAFRALSPHQGRACLCR